MCDKSHSSINCDGDVPCADTRLSLLTSPMRAWTVGSSSLLLLIGAASLLGCSLIDDGSDADQGALLPNQDVVEGRFAPATFANIAQWFAAAGKDLHVDTTTYSLDWPLADSKTAVLNRFGTPILYTNIGYFSAGFNVLRSDPATVSDEVRAPHAGVAAVFDWRGNRVSEIFDPYSTIVAIYDPASHVITTLTHVSPESNLLTASGTVSVTARSKIGRLPRAPLAGADGARLSNVEVILFDGEQKKVLDPGRYFKSYADTAAPTVASVYLTDEDRTKNGKFKNGKQDLVLEAFDRDDASLRNLEIAAIAVTVHDQDSNTLLDLPRCDLGDIFTKLGSSDGQSRLTDLVDFGSAKSQRSGGWPSSDVDNVNRTFRYALTQLSVGPDGSCQVRADDQGFLDVANLTTKLFVNVSVWDRKGNTSSKDLTVEREANSQFFAVTGTVRGLTSTLKLKANGETIDVSQDGEFRFTPIKVGRTYTVTIAEQPTGQLCEVKNETGTMDVGDVTNVEVKCVAAHKVGGTISGLAASAGLTLKTNGMTLRRTENGPFAFTTPLVVGTAYEVTISAQPSTSTRCTVENGTGTVGDADVDTVKITCP